MPIPSGFSELLYGTVVYMVVCRVYTPTIVVTALSEHINHLAYVIRIIIKKSIQETDKINTEAEL